MKHQCKSSVTVEDSRSGLHYLICIKKGGISQLFIESNSIVLREQHYIRHTNSKTITMTPPTRKRTFRSALSMGDITQPENAFPQLSDEAPPDRSPDVVESPTTSEESTGSASTRYYRRWIDELRRNAERRHEERMHEERKEAEKNKEEEKKREEEDKAEEEKIEAERKSDEEGKNRKDEKRKIWIEAKSRWHRVAETRLRASNEHDKMREKLDQAHQTLSRMENEIRDFELLEWRLRTKMEEAERSFMEDS